MKVRGTDFVMYPVSNLATAARFYREMLGLPQEIYSEEWQWAEFNCGNVTLALHGGTQLPKEVPGGRIALAVDDVHAAYAELKGKGARVLGEPVDYTVCRAVEVLDPDGNTVILHQRADGTCGSSQGDQ
jgi:predicted enzyme related to lactoylglutathione lyase